MAFSKSQDTILKLRGLYSNFNELSTAPEGALLRADNIEILSDSLAEPRRGFETVSPGYTDITDRTAIMWFYQDKQFAHHGPSQAEDTVSYLNSGVWTAISGTYLAPTDFKMRQLSTQKNLYFTTSAGVYKLDAYNATPKLSGAYKALDLTAALSGSSGFLAIGFRCAYRLVWGYVDANNKTIIGAPSGREDITNPPSGGTSPACDVVLTATIPTGITTSWFYQVYRSAQFAEAVEPNDELQLVYESFPNSTDISNGYVSFTDNVIDSLRGATLYTSPSQEGLAYQNERPPLATCIEDFRGVTFYGNTTSKHRFYLTLIATGGSSGVQNDDTITIGGVVYTAKASETAASGQFKVYTTGSAAQNIRDTTLSLIRVINKYSSSTVYAFYLSGTSDLPGKILLEERAIGGSAFYLVTSRATCWSPSDMATSGTATASTNDSFSNGIMWAKPGQSEHVPLVNKNTSIGEESSPIRALKANKEGLFILKDDGVYRLTGYYPSFQVELFDSSARIIGAESPVILNNQVYCLTDQGVTVLSDSAKVISFPIEDALRPLISGNLDLVKELVFSVGYEDDRKFYLFMPSGAEDTYPTQAFVYNTITKAWVMHHLSATCGVVKDSRLYLGHAESNYIWKDRKSFTNLDYIDPGYTTSILSISNNIIELAAGVDTIQVGDILYQSSTIFSIITVVDTVAATVTVYSDPGFTVASVDVFKAIETNIQWLPVVNENPGVLKQNHTIKLLMKQDFIGDATMYFKSELQAAEEHVTIVGGAIGNWGLGNWGQFVWGGERTRQNRRQWIPRNMQRSSELIARFYHYYGYTYWQLQGIIVYGTMGSERSTRT